MSQTRIISASEFKAIKGKKVQREQKVQVAVCDYIKKTYPQVIFFCDLASGMNLGKHIGGMNSRLRSSRGIPDLFISEPASTRSGQSYNGLYIELKKDGAKVFKKDGSLVADEHIQEQAVMIDRLRSRGYKAEFAIGFDQAKKIIDEYLC